MTTIDELLSMPATFKDIQDRQQGRFIFDIGQLGEVSHLSGQIGQEPDYHYREAYFLKIGVILKGKHFPHFHIIGETAEGYRNSSTIQLIDFEQRRIRTESGNLYGYDELMFDHPDHLTLHICATLHWWGLSKFFNTPKIYL